MQFAALVSDIQTGDAEDADENVFDTCSIEDESDYECAVA